MGTFSPVGVLLTRLIFGEICLWRMFSLLSLFPLPSRHFFDADAAVFHLAAVAFEADLAGGGYFHRSFQ